MKIKMKKNCKNEACKKGQTISELKEKNKQLQDEIDSLWAMMDEITKSDIENFSHILEELKADVVSRALMVTKKVADC